MWFFRPCPSNILSLPPTAIWSQKETAITTQACKGQHVLKTLSAYYDFLSVWSFLPQSIFQNKNSSVSFSVCLNHLSTKCLSLLPSDGGPADGQGSGLWGRRSFPGQLQTTCPQTDGGGGAGGAGLGPHVRWPLFIHVDLVLTGCRLKARRKWDFHIFFDWRIEEEEQDGGDREPWTRQWRSSAFRPDTCL